MPARKGPVELAGEICNYKDATHGCKMYARYCVGSIGSDGKIYVIGAACGAHFGFYVRKAWRELNSAALIQEIPGMWRG